MTQQVLADRVFTVECRRIFARAETLASELGHPAVGTEHLLLAMLEIPSFGAARLAEAGADAQRVRAEVTRVPIMSATMKRWDYLASMWQMCSGDSEERMGLARRSCRGLTSPCRSSLTPRTNPSLTSRTSASIATAHNWN